MSKSALYLFVALICMVLAGGCGPQSRSFSVIVKNDSLEPMTVWLTKDGPPVEVQWLSPEQLAISGKAKDMPVTGVVIPPGKTGEIGPIEGKFDSGTNAILRVYRGQKLFNDLLATSTDSLDRSDIKLTTGKNSVVVGRGGTINHGAAE